jgi:hypothetical protein
MGDFLKDHDYYDDNLKADDLIFINLKVESKKAVDEIKKLSKFLKHDLRNELEMRISN